MFTFSSLQNDMVKRGHPHMPLQTSVDVARQRESSRLLDISGAYFVQYIDSDEGQAPELKCRERAPPGRLGVSLHRKYSRCS